MSTPRPQKIGAFSAFALLRDRDFALLWSAQVISGLGDWALYIVIPVTIYNATSSKAALGMSILFGTVPALLFNLLGGVLADRWDRQRTMIVSDIGRTLVILLLLGVSNVKHFGPRDLALFYLVFFLVSSLSCFFGPAQSSLLRALVPREKLLQANGLVFSGAQATWLLGPALGALLLTWLHPKGVFVFDAATFALSVALVARIRFVPAAVSARPPLSPAGVWREACVGLSYIKGSRILRPAFIVLVIVVSGSDIVNALEFPFVRDIWHGTGAQFALLVAVSFSAALVTNLAASGLLRETPPARLLAFGFTLMALTGLVFAGAPSIWIGGAMLFLTGIGNTIENLGNIMLFQASVPHHLQGRVTGALRLAQQLSMTLGGLLTVGLTTLFASSASLRPIFAGVALIYLLCALLTQRTLGSVTMQDVLEAGAQTEETNLEETNLEETNLEETNLEPARV